MAKVIEFYIPTRFKKKVTWVSANERGKIIQFLLSGKEVSLARQN
jgi:hypothetical protein